MNKRIVTSILAVVMLLSMLMAAVPAYAASSAATGAGLNVSETSLHPGDTFTVTLTIPAISEKISDASLKVSFDKNAFEVTSVSAPAISGCSVMFSNPADANGGGAFSCTQSSLTYEADVTFSGYELSASFVVKETAELKSYNFAITSCVLGSLDEYGGPTNVTPAMQVENVAVTVAKKPIPATGITLDKSELKLTAGETGELKATVAPADATDDIVWSSENANVATVDQDGNVTAVAEGETTITATAGSVSASCEVIVGKAPCLHTNKVTTIEAVAATCATTGKTAEIKCGDCGAVIQESVETPKTPDDHSAYGEESVEAKEATCQEGGHGAYTFCTGCKTVLSGDATPTDPVDHSFTAEKAEEKYLKSPATCTSKAVYYKSCSMCGEKGTETFESGETVPHNYTAVVTAPTCTEAGYTTHTCSVCGDKYTDTAVEKLGHSYEAVVTAPTCTEAGYTTHTCTVCSDSYTDSEVDKLGHTAPTGWSSDETGHWKECPVCRENKTELEAHSFKLNGDQEICEICDYNKDHVHTTGIFVAQVDATCTENGTKAYYTCSGCSKKFADGFLSFELNDIVIPATGHSYEAVVTAPTCTEAGYTTHTCSVCGDSYKDAETAATGHNYEAVVTAPTCTAEGYTTYTCSCGDTYTGDEVAATGHNYEGVVTAPTCTEKGYTTYTCSCGESYTDDEVAATGHSPENKLSDGEQTHWNACTVCGGKVNEAAHTYPADSDLCSACGHKKDHVHNLKLANAGKAATCVEEGIKPYYTCYCDDLFADNSGIVKFDSLADTVIPALGHDLADATCTEPKTCKRQDCEYTEGEALNHDIASATCTKDAYCKRGCTTFVPGEDQKATGHDVVDEDTWKHDEEHHWNECETCDDHVNEEKHTPATDRNEDGKRYCSVCKRVLPDRNVDDIPKTDDGSNTALWVSLIAVSVVGAAFCVLFSKKRKNA